MSLIFGKFDLQIRSLQIDSLQYQNSYIHFQILQKKSEALYFDVDANLAVIADARIINRTQLIKMLHLKDNTITDCQLLLHGYKKWQAHCVKHIVGNFAFAIWDANEKNLFIARDPLGQRSLFYTIGKDGTFYFSNLARPLFDFASTLKLNKFKIADYLAVFPLNEDSYFSAIKTLPAAHHLILTPENTKPKIQRYWSAAEIAADRFPLIHSEALYAEFRELFKTVIGDTLSLSDSMVCQLSGGLDSSAVTGMAAHLLPNKIIPAFGHIPSVKSSIKSRWNATYDDTHFMRAVAEKYSNIELHLIQSNNCLFSDSHEIHHYAGYPLSFPCNFLWIKRCVELARSMNKNIILTGEAGNYTLSWEGIRSFKKTRNFKNNLLIRWLRNFKRPWSFISAISDSLATETQLLGRFKRLNQNNDLQDPRIKIFDFHFDRDWSAITTVIRLLYGVEFIDPTADLRIVNFCLRSPVGIFRDDQQTRSLVRKSLGTLMPHCVRERTTRGLQCADWYHKIDSQKELIRDLLASWRFTPVADYIQVDYLLRKLKHWNYRIIANSEGKKYLYYKDEYRFKLLRSIEMGLFIQQYLKN